MTGRLRRSLAFLVLGFVLPGAAITVLVVTEIEDGPGMILLATLPVGLFLVLSHPLRSGDARRARSILRRTRWMLVAIDRTPDATDPTGLFSIIRTVGEHGPPSFWRIENVARPAWTGWAWLAGDPDGEWAILSPADPTDLVTIRRVADADAAASWAAASDAATPDGDLGEARSGTGPRGIPAVLRRTTVRLLLVADITLVVHQVLLRGTNDDGTAAIERHGERTTVVAVWSSGADRDWEVWYVDLDDWQTFGRGDVDAVGRTEVAVARSDRDVPAGSTMEIARRGDRAVEVGHRPVVRSKGLGSDLWARPSALAVGTLIPILFLAIARWIRRRRRFHNPDAVHDAD